MQGQFSTDRDPIRFGPLREGGYQMKQMEYTIKVVTDVPIDTSALVTAMTDIAGVDSAMVTNYRVLPAKKAAKP